MKILCQIFSGETIELEVSEDQDIDDVKKQISETKGAKIEDIKLLFKSKFLKSPSTLKECGVTDNAKLIVMVPNKKPAPQTNNASVQQPAEENKTPNQPEENKKVIQPEIAPLPTVERKSKIELPEDFEEKVKQLQELGYEYSECSRALRVAGFNTEIAGNLLLSGHVPDEVIYEMNENISGDGEDENGEEEDSLVFLTPEVKKHYEEHPEKIQEFIDMLALRDPACYFLAKNNPMLFLTQLGFDVSKFDLSKLGPKSMYQELLDKLTDEEKQIVKRLEEKGYDSMEVLQTFEACNKDEKLTEECLKAFKK